MDIALMYAILPFCVFIAPPIVGFFADKLGNYIRVLLMSIVGCAIFHTLLLAVPTNKHHVDYPNMTMSMTDHNVLLKWEPCPLKQNDCTMIRNPEEKEKDPIPIYFEMNECDIKCPMLTELILTQGRPFPWLLGRWCVHSENNELL